MSQQFALEGFDAPPKPTDRLFFAIFPDAKAAARIEQLAHGLRVEHGLKGSPLKTDRFHVTLHHLGDFPGVPQDIVAMAGKAAAALAMAPFEVAFDRVSSFAGRPAGRPFVLRGSDGVAALTAFQQALGSSMDRSGLGRRAERQYTPHVTLLYDDRIVPEQSVEAIRWTAHEFVLVHSLLGRTQHVPLGRWALRSQ